MVWSENRVKREIRKKRLIISDNNKSPIDVDSLIFGNGTSLELHLSMTAKEWCQTDNGLPHRPNDPTLENITQNHDGSNIKDVSNGITLKKGEYILWDVYEHIKMSKNIFARVEAKSKIARGGLTIHNTAPAIQHDFDGVLKLEICNHSEKPFILKPYKSKNDSGTIIAQVFFEERVDVSFFYKIIDLVELAFDKCKPLRMCYAIIFLVLSIFTAYGIFFKIL